MFARTEHAAPRPRAGARTASARRGAGQHLPAAGGLETPPPPAAPGKRGGGRGRGRRWGGGASPPLSLSPRLQAPPRLLLRRRRLLLLLTVPLWLSQPFCPALASRGNSREKEPTGPGPSAGAGARSGARASPPPRAGGGAEVGNSRGDRGTRFQPWRPSPPPPTPQLQETPPLRSGAFSQPPLLPSRQEMVQAPGAPAPLGNQNQESDRQVFRVVLTPRDRAEHPDRSSANCRRC